jgi:hypothetical protein
MIAADGVVGLPLISRGAIAPHLAVVQIAGEALRMDARTLECETRKSAVLHDALLYYGHGVLAAASQAALCHNYHNALQRLCRWLLAATDRLHTDHLDVTHEALSEVLGAPRRAVSAAALELQDAEAVRYRYGRIAILNRPRLERSACECYEALRSDGRPSSSGPEHAVGSAR